MLEASELTGPAAHLTPAQIRRMEPLEIFQMFDTDGSGLISFSGA